MESFSLIKSFSLTGIKRLKFMKLNFKSLVLVGITSILFGCAGTDQNDDATFMKDESKSLNLAEKMRTGGQQPTAVGLYKKILDETPNNVPATLGLAKSLNSLKRYREAQECLKKSLAENPNQISLEEELGKTYIGSHQPKEGIAIFESILKKDPQNQIALNGLGICHDLNYNHTTAQDYYLKALALYPNTKSTKSNLGLSYALSGNYTKGLSILEKISKSTNASVRDRQNLALAYGLSGQIDKAGQLYSIDLSEDAVRNNLAYIHILQHQHSQTLPIQEVKPILLEPLAPSEEKSSVTKEDPLKIVKETNNVQPPKTTKSIRPSLQATPKKKIEASQIQAAPPQKQSTLTHSDLTEDDELETALMLMQ